MRGSPLLFLLPVLVAMIPAPSSRAAQARPASMESLSFLLGDWSVELRRFPAGQGDAAGDSTGWTECTMEADQLRCRTRAELARGRPYEIDVTVVAADAGYRADVRDPGGATAYRGHWRRPDTLVFTSEGDAPVQRVLYRDAGPDRVWVYVEESSDGDVYRPRSEAVWTRAGGTWLPPGREDAGTSVTVDAIVPGAPERVAAMFLDPGALNRFMGDAARVGTAAGEPFEVAFLPASHPDSRLNSTRGAEILDSEPGRRLVVEWTAPPWLGELNRDPLPTWAEITFRAWQADAAATHVRVVHRGFQEGDDWERLRSFLRAGWTSILFRLQALLWSRQTGPEPG